MTYTYGDTNHKHAVTHLNGVQKYWYDANGNMVTRVVGGQTYNLSYDPENRLVGVSGAATATFVYDGDGKRVKATVGGTTTVYIGNYSEWTGSTSTMVKYIYAGGQRVAIRVGVGSTRYFLLSDHLGSTTVTANSSGAFYAELRFKAWGETRFSSGTTPTNRRFTGQYRESSLGGAEGLYFYNARWYDPLLGRFISPDTIIPGVKNPQAWDRYAYTLNNPVKYIDPNGHRSRCTEYEGCLSGPGEAVRQAWRLVRDWFFETGNQTQYFGPEEPLTQEIMHDPGMALFREEWAKSGYQVPFAYEHRADERTEDVDIGTIIKGVGVFYREHIVELGLSTMGLGSKDPEGPIDPVGGTIGSLDKISVTEAGGTNFRIEVRNDMGWSSATRFPGTNISIIQDRERSRWGPGGTTRQYFY